METDDILTDQMEICRPELIEFFIMVPVAVIADPCDIVGQGVQPYIGHMLRIKVHRDPPLKGSPGYAEIL